MPLDEALGALGKGDKVATVLPNCLELLTLFWAVAIALMNYIPYFGSLVGVMLPVILSLGLGFRSTGWFGSTVQRQVNRSMRRMELYERNAARVYWPYEIRCELAPA